MLAWILSIVTVPRSIFVGTRLSGKSDDSGPARGRMAKIRVLLADDHEAMLEQVSSILSKDFELHRFSRSVRGIYSGPYSKEAQQFSAGG